jgi:hypothetical protein
MAANVGVYDGLGLERLLRPLQPPKRFAQAGKADKRDQL